MEVGSAGRKVGSPNSPPVPSTSRPVSASIYAVRHGRPAGQGCQGSIPCFSLFRATSRAAGAGVQYEFRSSCLAGLRPREANVRGPRPCLQVRSAAWWVAGDCQVDSVPARVQSSNPEDAGRWTCVLISSPWGQGAGGVESLPPLTHHHFLGVGSLKGVSWHGVGLGEPGSQGRGLILDAAPQELTQTSGQHAAARWADKCLRTGVRLLPRLNS